MESMESGFDGHANTVRQYLKQLRNRLAKPFSKHSSNGDDTFDLLKNLELIHKRLDEENEVAMKWKNVTNYQLFDIMVTVSDNKKRQIAIDQYKNFVINQLCDINDKMKELYFDTEKDMKIIQKKLKEMRSLFKRESLRKDLIKLNGLLQKTSYISDIIVSQIEYLQFKII